MIEFVPATADHLRALYADLPRTVRAVAAVEDGRVLGVAGLYRDREAEVVFAKLTPELTKNRRAVIHGARHVMRLFGRRVLAMCDTDQASAPGFLRHFGFRAIGHGVYAWTR